MPGQAKLDPPLPPPAYLPRPRLDAVIDRAIHARLACVVADAGFGKSSLLGSFATRVSCAWYTVTSDDAAAPVLARGLAEALATRVHGYRTEIVSAAAASWRSDAPPETGRIEAVAGLVCGALQGLLTDLVLVLDDTHEIAADGPSAALLDAICRQAPDTLHIVIASRSEPPFSLDRLRREGGPIEIGGADLLFTADEVDGVLRSFQGRHAEEMTRTVLDATGGWPAAVTLVAGVLAGSPPEERDRFLRRLTAGELPAGLLVGAVVDAKPEALKELIRTVLPLDRFTVDLCTAIGVEDAAASVRALRSGGFLSAHGPDAEWYKLNAVVAEYAEAHLPLERKRRADVLSVAGRFLEREGQVAGALRCSIAAGEEDRVAQLLAEHGDRLIAAGDSETVLSATSFLRSDVGGTVARLVGDARLLQGDWDAALASYLGAGAGSETLDPAVAWRIGSVYSSRGLVDRAIETYSRAGPEGTRNDMAMLFAWRAQACFQRGDAAGCAEHAERAIELAEEAGDDLPLAAAHAAQGFAAVLAQDPVREMTHWQRALDHAERAGDVQWIVRLRTLRATRSVVEDAYDEALADLDVVLELGEATGLGFTNAQVLTTRGVVRFYQGALEESYADLRAAVAAYERVGSTAAAYPLRALGDVHRSQGNIELARGSYLRALEVAETGGTVTTLAMARAGLAWAIVSDEPAEAARLLAQALELDGALENVYVREAAAAVELARGAPEQARMHGEHAVAIARRQNNLAAEAESLEVLAQIGDDESRVKLEAALDIWRRIGSPLGEGRVVLALARGSDGPSAHDLAQRAERILRSIGARRLAVEASELIGRLALEDRPAVAIKTLGGFRVERRGVRVPITEWQSRKARELLKVLVARRGKPVTRELLIETTWPGEDPAKAANRLSVALSTIRSVLDPERDGAPDRFVVADQTSVALSTENLTVDVDRFLRDAARGLELRRAGQMDEASTFLLSAEATYAGDFLEEEPYEDWAVALREESRAVYISVARALAEDADRSGDHDAACRYLLRILERDPYDEHANLELVAALERDGRRGESRRAYRTYCGRMREIGIEAAAFPAPDMSASSAV